MKKFFHKQRKNLAGEPLVGGEPAHRILQIVRSFPLAVNYAGGVEIQITAEGADLQMFERAYAWIEMEVIADEMKCSDAAAHSSVDPERHRYIILNELMFWTYFALDHFPDDALWAPQPRRRLFGPSVGPPRITHGRIGHA
jgi:hypothetical protein